MKQTSINVTALGLEEEALEAAYWHKGLCKLINGDLYVDPEDFHLVMENLEEEFIYDKDT